MSLDGPVVCPNFTSRDNELDSLRQVAARVADGLGQVVLVSGEAGIGKSRLVQELCDGLADQGWLIHHGNSFERDRVVPFAPFLDALHTILATLSPGEVERLLGPALPDLAQLLPELGAHARDSDTVPVQVKRRIHFALGSVFSQLAATQPLLLVLEDLHWADDSSLEVLAALARRIPRERILLIGTFREDEISPELRTLLSELDRSRTSLELRLNRLPPDGVAAMLMAIFKSDRPPRTDVVEAIYSLTEGNPFFVEELVRSLPWRDDDFWTHASSARGRSLEPRLPRSIQDAVSERTDRLSPQARQVLALAAVAGRRFGFQLLQELAGHDESKLLSLIKELVAAQLVVEVERRGDQFAFRHALTREAVYQQLLGRERRGLHRRIADTLEQGFATPLEPRLEDLAYHFSEAGVWDKAFTYAERAGKRAAGLYAQTSAVEHYTRALEAAQRQGIAAPRSLLRARGLGYGHLGNFDLARADHEAALEAARLDGDQRDEWQALMDLGFLWAGRAYQQTHSCFDEALDLARRLDDPPVLAHSLNRVGNWHVNVEQPAVGERYHREALAIFERLDDRYGLAETLDLLGLARYMQADLIEAVVYRDRAIALFRDLEDRVGLTTALAHRAASVTTYHSATAAALAQFQREAPLIAEEALRLAQASGLRDSEAFARMILAGVLGRMGEYARAFAEVEMALRIADDIDHHQWMCASHYTLAEMYRELLDPRAAHEHFDEALRLAREVGSGNWTTVISGSLASMLLSSGDTTVAAALLRQFAVDDTRPETMGQRQVRLAAAELALSQGDAERALRLLDALCGSGETPTAPDVDLVRGRALRLAGRPVDAEAALHAALAHAASNQLVSVTWRAQSELAATLEAQGLRAEADAARTRALESVEGIVNRLPDAYPRAVFRTEAHRAIGIGARTRQRLARGPHGLTTRERQVAVLIAAGHTNRAIAEQLVVSERTVESHVSGILAKLGFSTRAQIAAWATAQALSASQPG
jgi:DNA-binding NarL/FixJ family response regulator